MIELQHPDASSLAQPTIQENSALIRLIILLCSAPISHKLTKIYETSLFSLFFNSKSWIFFQKNLKILIFLKKLLSNDKVFLK